MATAAEQNLVQLRAFELRANADVEHASVTYGDEGRTFQIMEAIRSGDEQDAPGVLVSPDGIVVVDSAANSALAEILAQQTFLKDTKVPEDLTEAALKEAKKTLKAQAAEGPDPVGIESIKAQAQFEKGEAPKADADETEGAGGPPAETTTTSRRRSGAAS